jgi:YjjG family noncanonical pyrimidine nucleotidase
MSTNYIYFDIDNTLLNHSRAETAAQKEIYSMYTELQSVTEIEWLDGYRRINLQLWKQYQRGEIDREYLQFTRFKGTMETLGITTERSEEIGTNYMMKYREYWTWVDGAEKVLEQIAEKYPVGFITNGFLETQRNKVEFMNLGRFGENVIISEEIGVMKPDQRVFDIATEKAGTPRYSILYVGDSYSSDILGGKNAGWKTAWFTALNGGIQHGQTADFIFDRFSMLTSFLNSGI